MNYKILLLADECTDNMSDVEEINEEKFEEILNENEILKREIQELKSQALARDLETRRELTEMYKKVINKIEEDYK